MNVAATAIDGLPETPLSAAGFNTRFLIHEPANELTEACLMALDQRISDAGLTIAGRQVQRTIKFGEGVLNLEFVKNRVDASIRTVYLSPIFKCYGADFEKKHGSVLAAVQSSPRPTHRHARP